MLTSNRRRAGRAATVLCSLILFLLLGAATTARAADVLVTMPFENVSGRAEYHWVGESFAVLLSDLLDTPGLVVIRPDERNLAFERVGVRVTDLLTRAAEIRVAEAANANLILIGTYDIGGDQKKDTTIAITAKLIETREGRLVGNVLNFSGLLSDLQEMQGKLAWNILYSRDPALPYSTDQMIRRARSVPPRAYESFVKGIQTADQKLRENFLQRAIMEYDKESKTGHYAQAIYELGWLNFQQRDFAEASKWFKQLYKDDPHYLEGLFYMGLSYYNTGHVNESAEAFEKLVEPLPMLEVLNNAGAMLVAKGDVERALPILYRAVYANPNDVTLRFNYGYALWRKGDFQGALPNLRVVTAANPRDGIAFYIYAKSLASAGMTAEAAEADQEARRHLSDYAKWEVAPERIPSLVRMRFEFNRASLYKIERQQQGGPTLPRGQTVSTQQGLERARQLFEAKNDTEALNELQRLLVTDATVAEAHLLRGKIYQRRNEVENAISALSAAVYWNPRLVAAHVALGQLYLGRNDRTRALAHSKQALEIDPEDRDALALKRQIETGR